MKSYNSSDPLNAETAEIEDTSAQEKKQDDRDLPPAQRNTHPRLSLLNSRTFFRARSECLNCDEYYCTE